MTDREIIEAVQTWFNNKCVSSISPEQYDTDNPKISIVRRMINSWKIFCDDKCAGMDFECALRNYLLSFGTDIIIPGYVPENNNKFGLLSEQDSGRVFINYDFPDYINKEFADSVFRMEKGEHNIRNEFSPVHPYIYHLTNKRFSSFKSIEQQLAVMGALRVPDGYTALIAMATGGGKSLISFSVAYQKQEGLTLIIVPTISLMLDQYRNAMSIIAPENKKEIMYYHTGCDVAEVSRAISDREVRMLFISPESVIKNKVLYNSLIKANNEGYLNNLIIDEAHIIIDWGSSFRTDFQCLDSFRNELIHNNQLIRTFLLSATFSKKTTEDLKLFYSENNRWIEIRLDELRKEPRFDIIKCRSYTEKHRRIRELVCKLPHPMIVYVNTPDDAEKLQKELSEYGFVNTRIFTGKTVSSKRESIIEEWTDDKFDLMIATCAFGIGVDKKDVRTVLHTYIPSSPDQYYQECGRGGRDGFPSLSVMLYTEDDINASKSLIQKVLTVEKLCGRWFSMINSNKANIRLGRITLDTSVKPDYRESASFYTGINNADVTWNVYVILLLRRARLINIEHVDYDNGNYIFTVSISDGETDGISNQAIMYNDQISLSLFSKVRDEEFRRISKGINEMIMMLKRIGKECWSSMFNESYILTEEYCAGCNYHNKPVIGNTSSFKLKKTVPFPVSNASEKVNRLMGNMKEMLIINENDNKLLINQLASAGADMIVLPENTELNVEDLSSCSIGMMIIGFKEFFELCRRNNSFYLSGSIVFEVGKNESLAEKLLSVRAGKNYKGIYIVNNNFYVSGNKKNISELINGPCIRDYLIEKELG